MKRSIVIQVIASLFLCVTAANAQDCNSSELSHYGFEHLNKAIAYVKMMPGTEKQAIAEYEAILQTDSLWCPNVYLDLGKLCEYVAENLDVSYYNKAIQYYKKYYSFDESDEVKGKIIQLETKKEVLGQTLGEDAVKKGVKIEMVFVEGMLNEDTTACVHSFYIGKYELSQRQWQSVMNSNPSYFRGPNLPVEQICDKYELFFKELNRVTGANYRLPTSTEWYYAARGGKFMENYTYSGSFAENKVAWFSSNSENRTHEVGEKEPNSLGIYDMSGNVSELCVVSKGKIIPIGGNYRSEPYDLSVDTNILRGMEYVKDKGEIVSVTIRGKNKDGFYQDYEEKLLNSSNIGIRLVQGADINEMSPEERQWDTWIKQKVARLENERLQREEEEQRKKEEEQRKLERRNLWRTGSRTGGGYPSVRGGLRFDYNFQANSFVGTKDVLMNDFFSHTMFGIVLRIPIGAFFYVEPQIKAGIESDWELVAEEKYFLDRLSTCFDNVQAIHLEAPLIVGGIYRFKNADDAAVRAYMGGQYCPIIKTRIAADDPNRISYFAALFGLGLDMGLLSLDLSYRKPIKTESNMAIQGFTVSLSIMFGSYY